MRREGHLQTEDLHQWAGSTTNQNPVKTVGVHGKVLYTGMVGVTIAYLVVTVILSMKCNSVLSEIPKDEIV